MIALPRPRRRVRRWLTLGLLLPLVVMTLAAINLLVLVRPGQIEARARAFLQERLPHGFHFESARFGLFSGLSLTHLVINNPPTAREPQAATADELTVVFRLLDLWRGRVTVEEIQVRSPEVHLELLGNQLNLGLLIHPTATAADRDLVLPSLDVSDLRVHLCPDTLAPLGEPLRFPRLTLSLPDGPGQEFELSGTGQVAGVRHIRLGGHGDARGTFVGQVEVLRLSILPELRARLPEPLHAIWDATQPGGRADLTLGVRLADWRLADWHADVRIVEGQLTAQDYGVELRNLGGTLRVTRQRIETRGALTGIVDHGEALLDGSMDLDPTGTPTHADLVLELGEIALSEQQERFFPTEFLAAWRRLAPRGRVGLRVRVAGALPPEDIHSELVLHGVDLAIQDTPYRLEDLRGTLRLEDRTVVVDPANRLTGRVGASPVAAWGRVPLSPTGELDVHAQVLEFPLDRTLEETLPPIVREHYMRYEPAGLIDGTLWVHGSAEDPEVGFEATLSRGSMRYELFPYKLEDVHGEAYYQRRKSTLPGNRHLITFKPLRGRNGSSHATLQAGTIGWGGSDPYHLELILHCEGLLIDDGLLRALPDGAESVVRSFHLDGQVEAQVELFTRPVIHATTAEDPQPAEDPQLPSPEPEDPVRPAHSPRSSLEVRTTVKVLPPLNFRYAALPYPLVFRSGQAIHTLSTGRIQFVEMTTDPEVGPRLIFDGVYADDPDEPGRKVLDLNRIEVLPWRGGPGLALDDERLRAALPRDLQELVRKLQLKGFLSGVLGVTYRHVPEGPDQQRAEAVEYQGQMTAHGLDIDFGVHFSEVQALASFAGTYGPGQPHTFRGDATLDHLRFSRFRVRDTLVQFVYGRLHDVIRADGEGRATAPPGGHFTVTPFLRGRLANADLTHNLQVSVRRGNLYQGNLEGFIYVETDEPRDFHVDLRADDVQIALGARDLLRQEQAEGVARGWTRFTGRGSDPASIQGRGGFTIEKARLQQLPLFVASITRIANLNLGAHASRHISGVDARFKIRRQKFWFDDYDDLTITSPALTLRGRGTMDFQQNLFLYLQPTLLTDHIPLVNLVVKGLLQTVRLQGPLENPEALWAPLLEYVNSGMED